MVTSASNLVLNKLTSGPGYVYYSKNPQSIFPKNKPGHHLLQSSNGTSTAATIMA